MTRYCYDAVGNRTSWTDPLQAVTSYAYDLAGNKTKETDRLGRVSTFVYDAANRLVEERWQASASAAVFHTITRFYDGADQLLGVTETDTANPAATTAWQYTHDAAGNVVKSRMAPGEIVQTPVVYAPQSPGGTIATTDFTIDWDGDGKGERYDGYEITLAVGDQLLITASSSAFDPVVLLQKPGGTLATALFDDNSGGGTAVRLLVTADTAGTWVIRITARDENAVGAYDLRWISGNAIVPTALIEYDFGYDKAGNLLLATEDQAAIAQFGSLGPAAAGLGITTSYTVNALDQVTGYRHLSKADNNTDVVAKRAVYKYRGDGSVDTVTRFAGAGVNPVGISTAAYDGLSRLTGITHAPTASPSISYGYTYDAAGRMETMTTPEGKSTFTLDATDQLLSASRTGENYAYDKTGNRTSGGTQTGSGNRLAFDGTYRYAYDAEGNRTAKFKDTNAEGTLSPGDTDVTVYAYDQRNRLVAVSHVNAWTTAQGSALGGFSGSDTTFPGSDLDLRYTYDYADRRIRRSMDTDGAAGAGGESVSFAAYAGDARTLEIARPNDKLVIDSVRGPIGFLGQVIQRNFYGNGADEILAVDKITWNGTTPTTSTFWTFTDHQDTVRDIVSGNATDRGQVIEHRQYDSFGKIVTQTTSAATTPGIDFGYAGRPLESRTGLSDNRARWYEPTTGRFITEDPSGFKGGDANFYRYVGNDPLDKVDPSGLTGQWAGVAARQNALGMYQYYGALGSGTEALATDTALRTGPLYAPQASTSSLRAGTTAFFGSLGRSLAAIPSGLKSLVTGQAGRELGERAFQITSNNNGGKFNGEWGQVAYNIAGQMAGTQSMAEGLVGFDPATNTALAGQDRVIRFVGGAGQFAGLAAGALGGVGRLAGPNTFSPLPGSAAVTRFSNSVGIAVSRRLGRVEHAAVAGRNPVGLVPQPALETVADGVVYLRTDVTGGLKPYVGKSQSWERYLVRQGEHARDFPNSFFTFNELGRAIPGKALDVAEESWIRQLGGPTNKSNPGGLLSNKRYQMNEVRYRAANGTIDKP